MLKSLHPATVVTALLPVLAMAVGSIVASVSTTASAVAGELTDPLVLLLVAMLFVTLPVGRPADVSGTAPQRIRPSAPLIALAWAMNFVVVPVLALGVTAFVLPNDPLLRLGVMIYLLFPCTDWFLGFTRLAHGDTVTGAALIPINMVTQLSLYPVYLSWLTGASVVSTMAEIGPALVQWFALPALCALAVRAALRLTTPVDVHERILGVLDHLVTPVIAALILALFAANGSTVVQHPAAFGLVFVTVFVFFVVSWWLVTGVSHLTRLPYSAHALLSMTTSARNAPMMLAVTAVALLGQPVVQAAIVLGMLVEFPHLTVITQLLLRQRSRRPAAPTTRLTWRSYAS